MASDHLDLNGHNVDDIPDGLSNGSPQIPSDSRKSSDENEEIHIPPRVGDEYQAELPQLIGKSTYMSHSSTEACIQNFSIGLPIPLTWTKSPNHDGPENFGPFDSKINGEVKPEEESRASHGKGQRLVPGLNECWSDADKASFLLGLYIFLKNFVAVRRFLETKGTGAIMSLYYGKFYGRAEFRRWLECRKSKSKKCVFGQRIFSGLRQQELLARIFPRVSEELRNALLEVSKTFGEEKMSLEDYVSSLKAMVGMNILVEAVGIGSGKQDLTGMAFEPSKSNQAIPLRPEIPTGKACSSLTTSEINKFLSGDYRLSKARSNDLFWEAVWPRLLARGWHSEQPHSKNCLVFLGPGVKKFSRRKLVKGEHYFDSVTDVLSKVAKEPALIELDEENDGDKQKEELEWTREKNFEENEKEVPKQQRHFYLQPKTPSRDRDVLKFMVVDTSIGDGKVRELKTFPSEIPSMLISNGDCDRDTIFIDSTVMDNRATAKSHGKMPVNPDINKKLVLDSNDKVLPGNKKFGKSLMKRELEKGDNLAPINKCQKLNGETRDGAIRSIKGLGLENGSFKGLGLENGSSSISPGSFEFNENLSSPVGSRLDKLSSTSSSQGSPDENDIQEPSRANPMLIDLNLPQVSPDFENGEQDNGPILRPDDNNLPNSSEAQPQEAPVMNQRRQSTRTRPLTMRALEALAGGYLTVNRRRKGRDPHEDVGSSSRPLQRTRGPVGPNEGTSSSTVPQEAEAEAEAGPSNTGNQNTSEASKETNEESTSRQ
ncbi:hypothetical protein BUALT_Bualt12G0121200 [Buddleja alternifolia]|uniref:SANT domain-containing protein n=1 Tax=Buddleja alternifolia TaxID=168488 RepID=A0AAV6WR73_9LAMI|nr:hypothetical protein BUALT_Bualt12G0121200 [Buddleja alternifolia]